MIEAYSPNRPNKSDKSYNVLLTINRYGENQDSKKIIGNSSSVVVDFLRGFS